MLLCRSVSFIRFYPTHGKKIQKQIFTIAVKKTNFLFFKSNVSKDNLSAENAAKQIIWGLERLYESTYYESKYSDIKNRLCLKDPSYSPVHEEIHCFKLANALALSIFNKNSSGAPSGSQSNTSSSFTQNTDSPATTKVPMIEELVKLLNSFFNSNPNICGKKLKNHEIPTIAFVFLDKEQQVLRGFIQRKPDHPSTNSYVLLDNSITRLKNTYYSLIMKSTIQQAPPSGSGSGAPLGSMIVNARGGIKILIPNDQNSYPSTLTTPAEISPNNLKNQNYQKEIFAALENVTWNISNVNNNWKNGGSEVSLSNNKFRGVRNSNNGNSANLSSVESVDNRNNRINSETSQKVAGENSFGKEGQSDIFASTEKGLDVRNKNGDKEYDIAEDDIFFGFHRL